MSVYRDKTCEDISNLNNEAMRQGRDLEDYADYTNLLDSMISEWNLSGFRAAKYEFHAARRRNTAEKYAAAIGYDYEKPLESCQKRHSKSLRDGEIGMDGLEALVRKQETNPVQESTNNNERGK